MFLVIIRCRNVQRTVKYYHKITMQSILRNKINQLLNYGTQILGLDLKYFASGGFWTTLGQGVNSAMALALTVAFANLIPKETYGLYRYAISLANLLNIFTLTGMNTAIGQAAAAGNEGVLRTAVKHQLKWNLMMTAAMFGIGSYYFWNANPTMAASLFILGIFVPMTLALNSYAPYLDGKKQFKLNNLFIIGSTVIYVFGMLATLLLVKEVWALILIYSLTTFTANLFFYIKTLRLFNPPETPSKDALAYGWKLTYLRLIGPVVGQIDNIILNHFWGPAQLAVYSLARAMPDKITPVSKRIIGLGMPKLVQKSTEEINKVFYKRVLQGAGLGAILAAGYILLSPFVFKYLMPKYLESVFYSQILAIGFIFVMPMGYIGAAFDSHKMSVKPLFVLSGFVMNGVKIILYVSFGISGGILGLILAQLIYYALSTSLSVWFWKLEIKKSANFIKG